MADDQKVAFTIRVTRAEHEELLRRRDRSGYRGLGSYCRHVLVTGKAPKAAAPVINREEYGRLAGLGNNINQLARHLNAGNIVAHEDVAALRALFEETREELDCLRRALLGGATDTAREDS